MDINAIQIVRASLVPDIGVNLVPYFLTSLREQISTSWNLFIATVGQNSQSTSQQPLNQSGEDLIAELVKLEASGTDGSSTFISFEMLELAFMCIALQHLDHAAESYNSTNKNSEHKSAIKSSNAHNSLTVNSCTLALVSLRNLDLQLNLEGATGMTSTDITKWFEQLLSIYKPIACIVKDAICSDNPWDPAGATFARLVHLLHLYLQALLMLSKRQANQKKSFLMFAKSGAVELTLQILDCLLRIQPCPLSDDVNKEPKSATDTDMGKLLISKACRLLEAALGLHICKDVEELASAALQVSHTLDKSAYSTTNTSNVGKKRSRGEELSADTGAASVAASTYAPSFYSGFYDCIEKFSCLPLDMPVSVAVSTGISGYKVHSRIGGVATLLHLYSLGSLRVALSDKLAFDKAISSALVNEQEEGVGAKEAMKDNERVRMLHLLDTGDTGALLSYVSNAVTSRKHIMRLLSVTHAMIMRASPVVTSPQVGATEHLHQSYCRMQLMQALASALQSSLPTHDSLEAHVGLFREQMHRSISLLQIYMQSSSEGESAAERRIHAHVALELCCIQRLTSLDHRFLLTSSNIETEDQWSAEDFKQNPTSPLQHLYRALALTDIPDDTVAALDATLADDSLALQHAQEDIFLHLIQLHGDLSRMDILARDLCRLSCLSPSTVIDRNLRRLLGGHAAQSKLTACFASIPALQRHQVWDMLALSCINFSAMKGKDADSARASLGCVLSPVLRPLTSAQKTSENVRGPAAFSAPEPGPLRGILEYVISLLDALHSVSSDTLPSAKNKKKASVVPNAYSTSSMTGIADVHTIIVAILRVSASAIAQLSPADVATGAWTPLAILVCSKLASNMSILEPLAGLTNYLDKVQQQNAESVLCAASALLAVSNFTAIAAERLGAVAELPNGIEISKRVVDTLVCACQSYRTHAINMKDILIPVVRLFVQQAPCWSHLGQQIDSKALVTSLSEVLLNSHFDLLPSDTECRSETLRVLVADAPLLGAALRAAAKIGAQRLGAFWRSTGRRTKGTAFETINAIRLGLDFCLSQLPSDLSDKANVLSTIIPEEVSGLVGALVEALSLAANTVVNSTASDMKEVNESAAVLSESLLRHVRACNSMLSIDQNALWHQNNAKSMIALACSSSPRESQMHNPTLDLVCMLLDARLVGLLTGAHALSASSVNAEISDIFLSLRVWFESAIQESSSATALTEVQHTRLRNMRTIYGVLCASLTAVDWGTQSAAGSAAIVSKELENLVKPLYTAPLGTLPAEALYVLADILKSIYRIQSTKQNSAIDPTVAPLAGVTLPAALVTSAAENELIIREAWLYLLGTWLHAQRFRGLALDLQGCDRSLQNLIDTLRAIQSEAHLPCQSVISLAVSGLLLAAPSHHVMKLSSHLATKVQEQPLLSLRMSSAFMEAVTLHARHIGTGIIGLAQQLLIHSPSRLPRPSQHPSYEVITKNHTLTFFREAAFFLRRVLGMERSASASKKQRLVVSKAADGKDDDETERAVASWTPAGVGLVSQLSTQAMLWCQLQQPTPVVCELVSQTLAAAEVLLLGASQDGFGTGAGPLAIAVSQCVHILLHFPAGPYASQIMAAISAACRVFAAASQAKETGRHAPLLLSILLDLMSNSTFSIPKERLEALQPGMFALIDRCAANKETKQALAPLGEAARAVHAELHEKYVREYKFKGRV